MRARTQSAGRHWSSKFLFLAVAIGSAVGISNIWKFTYVAGANGGGAFVLIYVLALAGVALPALIAEFLIGRRGGASMVGTMRALSQREGISTAWRLYALVAITAIFIALSFYCVVAGWTIDYFVQSLVGRLKGVSADQASAALGAMQAAPARMAFYEAIFIALTAVIVAQGLHKGIERVLKWLTPGLFVILLMLFVYAIVAADFAAGFAFLFKPDFSKLTAEIVLMAVGQAFFSLGVGVGVMMTIGAYMKKDFSIVRSAIVVAVADGGVALVAGMAIFPIVFTYHLSPAEGPGLIFATLPIAFGQMPGGAVFGGLFFLLMAIAALTSAITILEAVIASLEDTTRFSRGTLSLVSGIALWVFGLGTVFSFNIWSQVHPMAWLGVLTDRTVFGVLDYLVSNILMPVGGILVAVLAGWALSRASCVDELGVGDGRLFRLWRFLVRYIVPVAIGGVFIASLR